MSLLTPAETIIHNGRIATLDWARSSAAHTSHGRGAYLPRHTSAIAGGSGHASADHAHQQHARAGDLWDHHWGFSCPCSAF
jgi:hypothetical protein